MRARARAPPPSTSHDVGPPPTTTNDVSRSISLSSRPGHAARSKHSSARCRTWRAWYKCFRRQIFSLPETTYKS
eukprot:516198-Pleurochrysis_carterae.AAC.1